MKYNVDEFYPTPESLLEKITAGIDWRKVTSILEPSAGKGDIAEYVKSKFYKFYRDIDIDCIELDKDLRSTLKGKEFRVVHDDFLTFHTYKKYDLIIMNPPFSNGVTHLLKALDMQKNGGAVICILNAETIRNPYTNERKVLVQKLHELEADIQYLQNEFTSAERPTGVEIAVIRILIPEKEQESYIFADMKKKMYHESDMQDSTDLAPNDFIKAIVQKYNLEVECGIRLIEEYQAMCPHLLNDLREDATYNNPILTMKIQDHAALSVNAFVKQVRMKYWNALFRNPKFSGNMTSNLSRQYYSRVSELADYDFSIYNIKCMQLEMSRSLIKGIENCIIELFDQLSHQYAYSDELKNNIHYYNGWKTNKAWYINKKVILPYMNAWRWNGYDPTQYELMCKLADIEKALNYLDGGLTECRNLESCLNDARLTGQTRKIRLKYFDVTFFKKGTCHIEFRNEELLKKFNIFGSQQKGWLPPAYGKKTYQQMEPEERAVIDEFEGEESYNKIVAASDYYIYNPQNSVKLLDSKESA